jgi:hypothetical protein
MSVYNLDSRMLAVRAPLKDSLRWQQMRQLFAIVACHGLGIGGDGWR